MRFGELFSSIGIELPDSVKNETVSKIVTDSRKVVDNCIFICLCGMSCDGHDYIEQAAKAGARVIVAERVRGVCVGGAAIILVENTRHTASLLYNRWFNSPSEQLKIIGVTGTNGKTSVCHMLLKIFEDAGFRCGMIGTVGSFSVGRRQLDVSGGNMTTPEPSRLYEILGEMKNDGAEYAFMEVSSHALAQCRTDAIRFDTAVFTNISEDHLDFHKSFDNYYKAKKKLFYQSDRAVVNIDDSYGRRLFRSLAKDKCCGEIKTTSRLVGDFCALGAEFSSKGCQYILKYSNEVQRVSLPLCGEFQADNSLQAAAVALMHKISAKEVLASLASLESISGRMEEARLHSKQKIKVYIDYAHTPDALERLLHSVRGIRGEEKGKIILLFGCGGEREIEKRPLMARIASRLADFVIVTDDNPRGENPEKIISDILRGIDKEKEFAVIYGRETAIKEAVCRYANDGDLLVLAGKGHECYRIDNDGKHDFDERKILSEAFISLYGNEDTD